MVGTVITMKAAAAVVQQEVLGMGEMEMMGVMEPIMEGVEVLGTPVVVEMEVLAEMMILVALDLLMAEVEEEMAMMREMTMQEMAQTVL
jgi:hypothetical protein